MRSQLQSILDAAAQTVARVPRNAGEALESLSSLVDPKALPPPNLRRVKHDELVKLLFPPGFLDAVQRRTVP